MEMLLYNIIQVRRSDGMPASGRHYRVECVESSLLDCPRYLP